MLVTAAAVPAFAQNGSASNFVPKLTLAYTDPDSGDSFECGDDCRRFSVPAGVELEVRVQVQHEGAVSRTEEVTWDLWFNQPNHPYPGFDFDSCFNEEAGAFDRGCWQALVDRVDRESWDHLLPDVVCVPVLEEASCGNGVVRLVMDPDFEGARRRGVYHFAVWANRFAAVPEEDEFDNFVGPIRVTVVPREVAEGRETAAPAAAPGGTGLILGPSSPMPYGVVVVPEEVETAFTLTSTRSQSLLEFSPACAGMVHVEVSQSGSLESMVVQVRKVSTGEVLIEAKGKGRLRLDGGIDSFHLKDGGAFEVMVVPGQGSRGIRGSIRVSYPARLRYMVDP